MADDRTSDEERHGLLSGVHDPSKEVASDDHEDLGWWQTPWSASKVTAFAIFSILLLIGATFAHTFIINPRITRANAKTASNGTHEFRRTVLLVSIDGLR